MYNELLMDHKTLGIIIIVVSGLILYSEKSGSQIFSALGLGLGSAIFFNLHKINKNKKDE